MKLNTNIIRSDSNGEEGFQAIMNLDKDGVVTNINYIYKTLAAWAPGELTGNHFSVIFDEHIIGNSTRHKNKFHPPQKY